MEYRRGIRIMEQAPGVAAVGKAAGDADRPKSIEAVGVLNAGPLKRAHRRRDTGTFIGNRRHDVHDRLDHRGGNAFRLQQSRRFARANLLVAADRLLDAMHVTDPLLDIARELEQVALADDYFVSRRLYPNVDFYSGIILRAIGIPVDMFTVMFAIGRTPGWIAHWKEVTDNPRQRIYRPRQVYTGPELSPWVPRDER